MSYPAWCTNEKVHVVFFLVVASVFLAAFCVDCTECEQRGGAYVRTFGGGYECVERRK